jgi:xylulose-5-phosphate/fructose-6-phosphate phosphoketolase
MDAINNAARTPDGSAELLEWCAAKLHEHYDFVVANLEDMPEIRNWKLPVQGN